MKLSIIIPAYNEERRLPKTLAAIDAYMRQHPSVGSGQDLSESDYEIIVVSDGSQDATAEVVLSLAKHNDNLRLIDNKENHGKGWVVRQGLLEAKGDYRLFMDADNSTTIDQIEKMWPLFESGLEVVIGSRDIKGAIISARQSWYRRVVGDLGNIVIQTVAGLWGIKDTQCGFKAFSAKAANRIFSKCLIDRWGFDIEALALAKKFGYKIQEIPVVWNNDAESKVKFSGMLKTFIEVFQIRGNLISGKYNE